MDLLRRNSVGQTGGVGMGTEMGNWQSVEEQILQGRGLSGKVVDDLWT